MAAGRKSRGAVPSILKGVPIVLAAAAGCAGPEGPAFLDPDAQASDLGTLISSADVRAASARLVTSLQASAAVRELHAPGRPLRVLLGRIRQFTTVTNFDKALFRNLLLEALTEADREGAFRFLDRGPVAGERRLAAAGEVERPEPLPGLQGADLVLEGEVREILKRRALEDGTEEERRTVQYALSLTRVEDGALLWADSYEVVKQQVIGAVYR